MDQISKKSAEWANYFCFIFLPLDDTVSKQHLTQRLGELCPVYRNLFLDSNWTASDGLQENVPCLYFEPIKQLSFSTTPIYIKN